MSERFTSLKKDGVYYVKDNKLNTTYPVYRVESLQDFYNDELMNYIIDELNKEGFKYEKDVGTD